MRMTLDDLEFDDVDLEKFNRVMALTTEIQRAIFQFAEKNGAQLVPDVILALVITMSVGINAIDDREDVYTEVASVIGMLRKLTNTTVQ